MRTAAEKARRATLVRAVQTIRKLRYGNGDRPCYSALEFLEELLRSKEPAPTLLSLWRSTSIPVGWKAWIIEAASRLDLPICVLPSLTFHGFVTCHPHCNGRTLWSFLTDEFRTSLTQAFLSLYPRPPRILYKPASRRPASRRQAAVRAAERQDRS